MPAKKPLKKSRSGPPQTYAELAARGVKRVVVYAPAETVATLEALQEAWGMGQSEVVRRALADALEREEAGAGSKK